MNVFLSNLLLLFAGFALLAALYALWRSLQLVLGQRMVEMERSSEAKDPRRRELMDERRALLETLRDLKHDLDTGKLSQQDFDEIDARTRTQTKEVLRKLDEQIEPFRAKAEALIEKAITK